MLWLKKKKSNQKHGAEIEVHLQEWYHIKNLRTTSPDVSESYLISSYRSLILPARQFLGKQETGSAHKNKTQTTCACITFEYENNSVLY